MSTERETLLRTSAPSLGALEKEAILRVLDSGFLGRGQETRLFEQELATYLNVEDVCCVSSGTAALHLALMAIGLKKGDEVLVPTLTYVASFQAVLVSGAIPQACDVLPNNGLIDLDDAERRLTARTRAIMPVHYAGYSGDSKRLYDFANAYDLRVIEDAAHAFGSSAYGKFVGASGDIGCFSFDPIKNITSGEGGAVVSSDPNVYDSVRRMSNLGIDSGGSDFNGNVTGPGWRYHMPDMMAAIGRVQLARFDQELKPKRQAITASYRKALADISNIEVLESSSTSVAHINVIKILGGRRDAVRDALALAGFDSRVHYRPNHLQPIFSDGAKRPVAEELYRQLVTLPSSLEIDESHCLEISQIIRSVVE